MLVRFVAALLLLVVVGGVALTPGSAQAASANPRLERELVAMTNVDRTSNGLTSLIEQDPLIDLARERSDDMLNRNYFAHEIPPTGDLVFVLMKERGIPYRIAGENLAWNNAAEAISVQRAEQDFMNSPAHRANIMKAEFDSIGVGAIPGTGKVMYTVLFMRPFDPAPVEPPAAAPAEPAEAPADE
jgi:uncharacterized protein YkwD